MNQKMQKCIAWHPLGTQGETLQDRQTAVFDQIWRLSYLAEKSPTPSVMFLTIDQSESCGYRRDARVINF